MAGMRGFAAPALRRSGLRPALALFAAGFAVCLALGVAIGLVAAPLRDGSLAPLGGDLLTAEELGDGWRKDERYFILNNNPNVTVYSLVFTHGEPPTADARGIAWVSVHAYVFSAQADADARFSESATRASTTQGWAWQTVSPLNDETLLGRRDFANQGQLLTEVAVYT